MKQKKLMVVLFTMVYVVQIFMSSIAFAASNTDSKIGQAKQETVFNDLIGHWAQKPIQFLSDKGYIKGYAANGGYVIKPDANITRAEYLSVLVKTKNLSVISKKTKSFKDVNTTDWYKEVVDIASSNGILSGYPDGSFKPNGPITRAEICALLVRINEWDAKDALNVKEKFSDIKENAWYYQAAMICKFKKIISGYPDGSFKPENKAKRAEAFAIIAKFLEQITVVKPTEKIPGVGGATPVPTVNSTATPTAKSTSIATPTSPTPTYSPVSNSGGGSSSGSNSSTSTPIATATATATSTATTIATATATPTATSIEAQTPAATATSIPTATATATVSVTATATVAATPTSIATPAATATEVSTATPAPTETSTDAATPTATAPATIAPATATPVVLSEQTTKLGDWNLYTVSTASVASATSVTSSVYEFVYAAAVTISDTGTSEDDIQLIHIDPYTLKSGEYELVFGVRSDINRSIRIVLEKSNEKVESVLDKEVKLNIGWNTNKIKFSLKDDTAVNLSVRLGYFNNDKDLNIHRVGLDNAYFTRLGDYVDPNKPVEDPNRFKNKVTNGDFSDATNGWWPGANISLTAENGVGVLTVPGGTANPWDVMAGNYLAFQLNKGRNYSVTFDVYSEVSQKGILQLVNSEEKDKEMSIKSFETSDGFTKITHEFTVSDDCLAKFAFQLGGAGTKGQNYRISIDNVEVKEVPKMIDVAVNGSFSSGKGGCWANKSTFDVVDGVGVITTNGGTQYPWDVMVGNPSLFTLEKGRTYSVTFDVYSEIAQDLKFQIVDSADKQILIKSVSVQANTTKTFTFENDFEVSDTCQAKWAFQVGGYGTAGETYKIMIDNIKIMHPDLTVTVEKEDPLANMVKNPGFEQGIKNWGIYTMVGGSATFNASSGEGRLNIKNTGTEDYAVQFFQDGMKLYKGNKYKLKFRYKADTERSAEVRIQQNGGTYIGYLDDKSLTFKNDWQTYEKEFTMDYDSDTAARLCFNLGKAGTASDVNQNICFDDFSLVMTQGSLPEEQKANPIRLNQVGYRPDDSKVAFVVSQDRTFKLYTADDKLFMTGNLPVYKADEKGEVLVDEKSGDITRSADFTNFNLEGSFYIKVRADKSPVFKIEPNVYDGLTAGVLKVFYYQRCGGNGITEEYAGEKFAHDPCHTGKAKYYDPTNEIYGSVEIDVSGGWHDAGDYGRYVTPASKAVADLLLTAEHFPAMADLDFGGPDKILAETRYEIEWMLKMQNPITGGVYHKVTTKNHASMTALPEADKDQLYLSPVSAQATADFAAVMAYAYRMYNKIDPAFAQECMVAAKKAWEWLTANPDANAYVDPSFFGTGTYNDGNAKDELFWAAAELFKTTKEEKYLDYLTSYVAGKSNLDNGFGWADMGSYAQVAYLTTESVDKNDELYKKIKQNFIDHAASIIETWKKDGYKVALDDYVWGSNKDLSDRAMILIIANMLEEKHEYKAAVLDQLNYLLGRNAMDISYVTGYGEKAAKHPHHRQSVINEQAVPGMLVGGPNGYIMDVNGDPVAKMVDEKTPPAKCYADVDGSYATNEICIYWNSPLVYILGYLYQK